MRNLTDNWSVIKLILRSLNSRSIISRPRKMSHLIKFVGIKIEKVLKNTNRNDFGQSQCKKGMEFTLVLVIKLERVIYFL